MIINSIALERDDEHGWTRLIAMEADPDTGALSVCDIAEYTDSFEDPTWTALCHPLPEWIQSGAGFRANENAIRDLRASLPSNATTRRRIRAMAETMTGESCPTIRHAREALLSHVKVMAS